MTGEDTSLVPVRDSPIVVPAVTAEKMVEHMAVFQKLKARLLNKDTDVVMIQGKPFVKRSGWRKLALAFNISDEILKEEKEDLEDGGVTWRIQVRAWAPNGRSAVGIGACSTKEREFSRVAHDLYAIAHTRAKNRAISDLIGSGEVSAEEIQAGPVQRPKPVAAQQTVKGVRSLDELDYRLREHIVDLEGTIRLLEHAKGFVVERVRYLDEDEWAMINDLIVSMGGEWISAGKASHWLIPRAE